MEAIKLECTYEERFSKKDSTKKYKAIFIRINDKYEKMVLVSYPEQVMIESSINDVVKPSDFLSEV